MEDIHAYRKSNIRGVISIINIALEKIGLDLKSLMKFDYIGNI